jgi:hypothetical protein
VSRRRGPTGVLKLSAVLALALAGAWGWSCSQTATGIVEIAWDANLTDSDLAGYRLYAHTDPNIFNLDPNSAAAVARTITLGTSVTDQIVTNLDASKTWFFAVTAFDLSGNESPFDPNQIVSAQPSVAPAITRVSPNTAQQGTPGVVVTINGANFVPQTTVDFGPGITVTSLNTTGVPSTLVATVNVSRVAQASNRTVVVTNPGGGSSSRTLAFNVTIDVTRLDIDLSTRIDVGDYVHILLGFPSMVGDAHYNTNIDFDVDGKVDGADIAIFFTFFGMQL